MATSNSSPLVETTFHERIIDAIASVAHRKNTAFTPLHAPFFHGREKEYVVDCVETGWVSSVGAYVDRFEKDLATYLGVERTIAVSNGTAALHLCLVAAGIGIGDEVLIPALTFVATANAVSYTGATPHFCDVSPRSLGLCPEALRQHLQDIAYYKNNAWHNKHTHNRLAAVIPMHCFGHPVDMKALGQVAEEYNLLIIEDAAESLGSTYHGLHMGQWGKMAAISFNGNKIITTGGGGAIATNDLDLAQRLKHLSTTAKASKEGYFYHDAVGYNYRMPNLNAALGCAQLEMLPLFLEQKRHIAHAYERAFNKVEGISFLAEPEKSRSNYWLCSAILDNTEALPYVLEATNQLGIMTRPLWNLMHTLPMYQHCPRMPLPVSEYLVQRVISLPSSPNLLSDSL